MKYMNFMSHICVEQIKTIIEMFVSRIVFLPHV